jgi:hypothetical protein
MPTRRESRGLDAFVSKRSIRVTGLDEVADMIGSLGKDGREAARLVLVEKGNEIVKRAKPLTPDDPETQGALRDSVRLSQTRASAKKGTITVSVMAGGKPLEKRLKGHKYSAWALVQHEDLALKHPYGGGPKYLERPTLEVAPSIPDAVLAALEKVAKK